MRKLLSIFFLTLYLTSVFSSLLPYIEYLVNYEYISTVLCVNKDNPEKHCNGKCHLEKELKKVVRTATPVENNNEKPVILVSSNENIAILNDYEINIVAPYKDLLNKYKYINKYYSKDINSDVFHPPQS